MVSFEGVAPSGFTMLQWMAPHPGVYEQHTLNPLGYLKRKRGDEVGVKGMECIEETSAPGLLECCLLPPV